MLVLDGVTCTMSLAHALPFCLSASSILRKLFPASLVYQAGARRRQQGSKAAAIAESRERTAVADAAGHMTHQQWEAMRASSAGLAHSMHVRELLLACYAAAAM